MRAPAEHDWSAKLRAQAAAAGEVSVRLEGPYGELAVDLEGAQYSSVLLLSGGVGVVRAQTRARAVLGKQMRRESFGGSRVETRTWVADGWVRMVDSESRARGPRAQLSYHRGAGADARHCQGAAL